MKNNNFPDTFKNIVVPKNTFILTYGDVTWIYSHIQSDPTNFARGLLKRRFDSVSRRFATVQDLAKACVAVIKTNPYEFENNSKDKNSYERFLRLKANNYKGIIKEFRSLWRGFDDNERKCTMQTINKDKKEFLKRIADYMRKNTIKLNKIKRSGSTRRQKAFEKNLEKLHETKNYVQKSFQNPQLLAFRKCLYQTIRRRERIPSFFTELSWDYLGISLNLKWADSDIVDFPLRFLLHLPSSVYNQLVKYWKSGESKNELLKPFEVQMRSSNFFKELEQLCTTVDPFLSFKRSDYISEIAYCINGDKLATATLLAVTLTESLIWDYAKLLNRRNIRIFKIKEIRKKEKYYPYQWSSDKKKYLNLKPSGRPQYANKFQLTSARGLLEATRLSEYFFPEVYNYLIDEFYDGRNLLAHGNWKNINWTKEATCATLCLREVIFAIHHTLNEIRLRK